MKVFPKFFAIIMALFMCFGTSGTSALAAESTSENVSQNTVVQDGETIVYQDEDMTIVQCSSERADDNENAIMSANSTDYGYVWLSSSSSGSFTVYTSNSGTIGVTLKAESSSNSSWAYMSVEKPNGSYFNSNVYIDPTTGNGEGAKYKMYFASSGTYTIHYMGYTSVGMRLMCWLY